MKRKFLAMILAVATITAMTACGSSDDGGSTGTAEKNDGELDAGGETITIWVPPFGNTDETDEEFWQRVLADAAEEVNAEIAVETVPWDNYEEKYMTGISGGTGPDIGYMYNEMLRSYVDMGVLNELDSYFSQEEVDQYLYWDYGQIDGKQYTLPFVVGAPRILYCNMDLLNEAGYDAPPTTWAELEEVALAVQDTTGKLGFQQYWGGYFGDLAETFYPYLWSAGGDIFDEEGNLTVNSEIGVETAEWIYGLKEKGILTDSVTATDATATADAFKQGELAMYVSSSTSASKIDEAGINWDFSPYLSQTGEEPGYTFVAADSLVMIGDTEYPEEVAHIMKAMTSPAVMEEFHQERYAMPPISEGEAYYDNEKFETMYEESAENFKPLPVVSNSSQIYTALFSNMQRMMMDEITPQEALDETVEYAETLQ